MFRKLRAMPETGTETLDMIVFNGKKYYLPGVARMLIGDLHKYPKNQQSRLQIHLH
jgi:hypothetical protein